MAEPNCGGGTGRKTGAETPDAASGAGCPRLGTMTAMFVERNGRKRESGQGMRLPTHYVFSRYLGQVRPVAKKERPVVTGRREREKKEFPLPNVGGEVRDGVSISNGEAISM